ncbi:pentapeptide repeat-containing protein [Phaeobacter gallaeciensis]|uniref:Low-complexity protein n=1 Tax=Phaeobacter gallaeciensis TaxID=60890 RepID=A0AAD0ECI4_9RHOB|nr:pentapeptide repeat-containing protein [Phaeobacter gallaeciensis]AHD09261.1 putative low-complexity protein [Phaeobacter gallaeciensis DSM 26640]ATE92524.1 putative low-complexity protein [Phaeobacter gallaeciensis]ATE97654.1 putative low-complexity protein [Phaeobacter gallaeciensis]ATF01189.1 putative low-complexity protein [Phaeobacter gallaeciensis]ATF05569.1 putative low-complexity protein [Phaeobacter gallaeciensis]
MTELTLPIDPKYFWAIVTLTGFALAVICVYAVMPRTEGKHTDPLDRLKIYLGAAQIPDGLFLMLALMWICLFLALFGGLLLMLWELIWFAVPQNPAAEASARFALLRLAAMTATLGAVVALPFTLIRIRLTREANKTADESLFNDKINAATEDLHAMRQRWDAERKQNIWEDDITRRNAAIDRLEGLVNERPDTAPRVSRLLSVYVRELSREVPPEIPPKDATPVELQNWAFELTVKRSDMENAVRVLGRLKQIEGVCPNEITIDLRQANLQKFDLGGLQFSGARLAETHMQGAGFNGAQLQETNLYYAQMQWADFHKAHMEKADLSAACMQGGHFVEAQMQEADLNFAKLHWADLSGVNLQRADLSHAQLRLTDLSGALLQGVDLSAAHMDGADLYQAQLQGANLSSALFGTHTKISGAELSASLLYGIDLSNQEIEFEQIRSGFGTAGTVLPGGDGPNSPNWPAHWPTLRMTAIEARNEWEKWQADPDNYTPPPAP